MVVREPVVTPDTVHPFWVDPPESERAVITIEDSQGNQQILTPPFKPKEIFGIDDAKFVIESYPHDNKDPIAKEIAKLQLPDPLTTPRVPTILGVEVVLNEVERIAKTYEPYQHAMYNRGKSSLERITRFLDCLKIPQEAKSSPTSTPKP